jgi:hypothetical protein
MEPVVVAGTVACSFGVAFLLQKLALSALFRILGACR